jgi:hypothetical protein
MCSTRTTLFQKLPIRFAQRLLINHHEAIRWLIPDRYFAFPGSGGRIYLTLRNPP